LAQATDLRFNGISTTLHFFISEGVIDERMVTAVCSKALHVLYFAWGAYLGLTSGHWGLVPFHLLLAAGYAWVAIGSSQPDLRWAKV
jgi:hypothetical protein